MNLRNLRPSTFKNLQNGWLMKNEMPFRLWNSSVRNWSRDGIGKEVYTHIWCGHPSYFFSWKMQIRSPGTLQLYCHAFGDFLDRNFTRISSSTAEEYSRFSKWTKSVLTTDVPNGCVANEFHRFRSARSCQCISLAHSRRFQMSDSICLRGC